MAFFAPGASRARTIDRVSSEFNSGRASTLRSRGSSQSARSQSLLTETLTSDDVGFTYYENFENADVGSSTPGGQSLGADPLGWTGNDIL